MEQGQISLFVYNSGNICAIILLTAYCILQIKLLLFIKGDQGSGKWHVSFTETMQNELCCYLSHKEIEDVLRQGNSSKNYNNGKTTATNQWRLPELYKPGSVKIWKSYGLNNGKLILTARKRDKDRSEIKNKQLNVFALNNTYNNGSFASASLYTCISSFILLLMN